MRRFLASILESWRAASKAPGLSLPSASARPDMASVPHLSTTAAINHPLPWRDEALPQVRQSSLRMRSEPGDIRHAVISGRLSEVCALLDQLVAEQASSHDFAATMH